MEIIKFLQGETRPANPPNPEQKDKATTEAIDQAFLNHALSKVGPEARRLLEVLSNLKMTPANMGRASQAMSDPQLPLEAGGDEDQRRAEKHGDRTDAETGR
jgi:hypothetical protein